MRLHPFHHDHEITNRRVRLARIQAKVNPTQEQKDAELKSEAIELIQRIQERCAKFQSA
jgi:hypothetical protein